MFGTDWSLFADARVNQSQSKHFFLISRTNNSGCIGTTRPVIELIQDMVTNILTKFGADWIIPVDSRV